MGSPPEHANRAGDTDEVSDDTTDDTINEDPDSVSDTEVGDVGTAVDSVDTSVNIRTDNETDTGATADAKLDTDADLDIDADISETDTNTAADVGENANYYSTVPDTTLELQALSSILISITVAFTLKPLALNSFQQQHTQPLLLHTQSSFYFILKSPVSKLGPVQPKKTPTCFEKILHDW
jgi:hypothetical protein